MNFREIIKATEYIMDAEKAAPAVVDGAPVSCKGMGTCEGCELPEIVGRTSSPHLTCDAAFIEWLLEQWKKEEEK